jgi:hypothetical protein
MNESNQRRLVVKKLKFATEVIALAKQNDVTDEELLETVDLIKSIHKEKATAATVTSQNLGDVVSKAILERTKEMGKLTDLNQINRCLSGQDEVGGISLAPETTIRLD